MATGGTIGTLSGDWKSTYTVTWSLISQSIANNTSTIRLTSVFYTGNSTNIASSYSSFVTDGTTMYSGAYSKNGAGNIFSKTKDITVKHNNDGSFPGRTVSFSTNDYIMGSQSGKGTISGVPKINRYVSLTNAPNFNLGNSETIQYSNPDGVSMQCALYQNNGSDVLAPYRSCSGSSYNFNFTDEELDRIYKAMGIGNSLTARIYLKGSNNTDYKTVVITLTGNQKTGHINISNSWYRTKKWLNIASVWKKCVRWVKVDGIWKRCI